MKEKLLLGGLLSMLGISGIYLIVNHFLLSMVIIILISLFFYNINVNNRYRRESLNIIKDKNKLYFYLSDDLICKVHLTDKRNFSTLLRSTITSVTISLKDTIRSVNFINFKNDTLLTEMNAKL